MAKEPQPWDVLPNTWAVLPELEDLPPLPTIHQSAVALGVSDHTIRRRITDGSLLAYRVGPRAIRVDKASLLKLASQPVVEAL